MGVTNHLLAGMILQGGTHLVALVLSTSESCHLWPQRFNSSPTPGRAVVGGTRPLLRRGVEKQQKQAGFESFLLS